VTSSFTLALAARKCAEDMIKSPWMNPSEHPCNPSDGENIYTYHAGSNAGQLFEHAVDLW